MKYITPRTTTRHQEGMSLVEVMVAMVISLFLLGGIIQVYLANKTSYAFTNANSRIQENGRYSMDIMSQNLRMAGFFGCAVFDPEDPASIDSIANNLDASHPNYDPELHDFLGQPLVEGTENDGLNGSDSITMRGAEPGNANIEPPFAVSTSAMVFVSQPNDLKADDIVMISNCRGADIFQVTNATVSGSSNNTAVVHNTGAGAPGNYNPDSCKGGNAHCLSQAYGADATIFKLRAITYSIKPGAGGEPALWQTTYDSDLAQVSDLELIEGIEQMQILYGVDTTDDDHPNQYLISSDVNNWYDVMSVRLMLLIRSQSENVVESPQVLDFNGTTSTATDQRLRQVFTTTITLRNRVSDT